MRRRVHQPFCLRVLGGLSALALASACNGDKKAEPSSTPQRSQAVTATAPAGSAAKVAPAPSASAPAVPKKPARKLCAGELDKPGKKLKKDDAEEASSEEEEESEGKKAKPAAKKPASGKAKKAS